MDLDKIWNEVLDKLEQVTYNITFKTYISVIEPKLVSKNTICLVCPSNYHIEGCKERCLDSISKAFYEVTGKNYEFVFDTFDDTEDDQDIWKKTLANIKTKVSRNIFYTYFKPMQVNFIDENTAYIICSSEYHIDICIKKYKKLILDAFLDVTGRQYTIYFDCTKEDSLESETWGLILKKIKNEVSTLCYETYFSIIIPKFIGEDMLNLIFPSKYYLDVCNSRYLYLISDAVKEVTNKEYKINLIEEIN